MDSVNEEKFNQAVSYMNKAQTDMDQANSIASGISIPSDFSGAASVQSTITSVTSELKPQVDNYASTFTGLQQNVANYIAMEKNAQVGASNLNSSSVLTGFNGKAAAVVTSNGIIDLSSFKATTTSRGTYYVWNNGKNTGLRNTCEIYIPNVSKITGTVIAFMRDVDMRKFKAGEMDTSCITIFPGTSGDIEMSKQQAQNIVADAKNIATLFGGNPNNLIVYGYSQAGSLAARMVMHNDPGTFKTAILASTRYGFGGVATDPNLKVITIIGNGEEGNDNGKTVKAAFDEFKATHSNPAEFYVVQPNEDTDRVNHFWINSVAIKSKVFNGKGVLDYAADANASATVTPLPEVAPSPEITPSTPTPTVPTTPSTPTPTVPTTPSTPTPTVPTTPSTPTPTVPTTPSTPSRPSTPTPSTPSPTPTPSTPTPSVSANILPENKFTASMPELKSGSLGAMEISSQSVKYEITNISDSDYQSYLTSLSEKGYKLSADGTYWINGDNRIYVNYLNSNLTINLSNSTYL